MSRLGLTRMRAAQTAPAACLLDRAVFALRLGGLNVPQEGLEELQRQRAREGGGGPSLTAFCCTPDQRDPQPPRRPPGDSPRGPRRWRARGSPSRCWSGARGRTTPGRPAAGNSNSSSSRSRRHGRRKGSLRLACLPQRHSHSSGLPAQPGPCRRCRLQQGRRQRYDSASGAPHPAHAAPPTPDAPNLMWKRCAAMDSWW